MNQNASMEALASQMMRAAQYWQPANLCLEVQMEEDIFLRGRLGSGRMLYLSVTLGPDSDPEEDTFFSVRENGKEVYGFSGAFKPTLSKVVEFAVIAVPA